MLNILHMEIRYINETDDRLAVSHVYEASWKSAYQGIVPQTYLDSIPAGRWISSLKNPAWHTLVMLDNDLIAGTSSYCASRFERMKGYGEIISIYLLPEYCGKGYGKRLLQAAVDGLYKIGFTDIFLWVLEGNNRARQFYEKFGFIITGDYLDDNIGGKPLRELQYVYHIY